MIHTLTLQRASLAMSSAAFGHVVHSHDPVAALIVGAVVGGFVLVWDAVFNP